MKTLKINPNKFYDYDRLDYGILPCQGCDDAIVEGDKFHFNPMIDDAKVFCSIDCLEINLKEEGWIL